MPARVQPCTGHACPILNYIGALVGWPFRTMPWVRCFDGLVGWRATLKAPVPVAMLCLTYALGCIHPCPWSRAPMAMGAFTFCNGRVHLLQWSGPPIALVALTHAQGCVHFTEGRGPFCPFLSLGSGLFCREFYILPGIAIWNKLYLQGFQKGWLAAPWPEMTRMKTLGSTPRYRPRIT